MYGRDELAAYPFFAQLLCNVSPETLHDPLTGVLARSFMLRFIQDLIARGTPFTLAIIDLDNFKNVNDRYGHRAGDQVLARVGGDLRAFVGSEGVVGRFGGDEFLFVRFGAADYETLHTFFMQMNHDGSVFRKTLHVEDADVYITATIGSAAFPGDAKDFEGLFLLADKALYRGKSKGRNCFIIYLATKHAALEIPKLAGLGLYEVLHAMADGFDGGGSVRDRLRRAFEPIRGGISLDRLLGVCADGALMDVCSGEIIRGGVAAEGLAPNGVRPVAEISALGEDHAALRDALLAVGVDAVMIAPVPDGRTFRCLILCPEPHTNRMWQDRDSVAAFLLARLLSQYEKECKAEKQH